MVISSEGQAKELLLNPRNSDQIAKARRLEERIKLHTEAVMDASEMQSRFAFFKKWVSDILPPDKMEAFCTLWQAPVETNELTESIFGELSRVFEAENPRTTHTFKDSETATDFINYLTEIGDGKFWSTAYWEELKSDHNSYIVVDLPAIQTSTKPEPYYYILDIDYIHDVSVTRDGKVDYIAFWCSEPSVIVLVDEQSILKFLVPKDANGIADIGKASLKSHVAHNLGRCPVVPLYFQPVSKNLTVVNHNPITKSLAALDWLLFYEVSKKYLETYAPYPIYATYSEIDDSYSETADNGEENLTVGIDHVLAEGEQILSKDHKNRNKANRKLIGPGTIQRYEAPKDSADSDLLSNPVQVIPAETLSLNYCKEAVDNLNNQIFANCVGKGGDVINNQAANELQVQSTFESRINVLSGIRGRIESCKEQVYEIMAELRYGDLFISTDESMGDQYFLTTISDQQKAYKESKETGVPLYELGNQLDSIYRNKYRDQPQVLKRNTILSHLEPYPGYTIQEIAELVGEGLADKDKFKIKLEFDSLIKRFEREQMNIVDFASARPIQTKVDIITQKLKEYVTENSASEQVQEPRGTGGFGKRPLPNPAREGGMGEGSEN